MLSTIKDRIRNSPLAYDALKAVKRLVSKQKDPAYEFFRKWSKGRDINFIQIGAADGLRNDPFREFIRRGWQGILVEPLPDVFELLKRNYASQDGLTFVNAAISNGGGSLSFWGFEESFLQSLPLEHRLDLQRKASFTRAHVEHYLPNKNDCRWIKEINIQCLSIAELLKRYWGTEPIHLLAIDAEGHERNIISGIDFGSFRPEVIFYEDHTLSADDRAAIESQLAAKGYRLKKILGDMAACLS